MPNFSLPDEVFIAAAHRFPTPFYLYDERGIRDRIRALRNAFAWAPDFQEYFAVKALPNPHILKIFQEEGCGLDCSSECELLLAERLGLSGEKIMFSANAMPACEFDHARRLNALINLDDSSDVDTLAAHGGIPETLCMRYNPGGTFTLGTAIMGAPGESKYGWTRAQLFSGVGRLKALGVKIETDMVIGRVLTVDELLEQGFRSVFIGTGAGLPRFMGIPGENLRGVYSANEFLTRVNLMQAYREDSDTPIRRAQRVAVVGGGNVAMDAVRCALRLGAREVSVVYRRSEAEMPARREEIDHAKEEGVTLRVLSNPTAILGDAQGEARGLQCIRMKLGEADASGRRRPVPEEGSEFVVEADCVIMAIGTSPNPLLRQTTEGLETDRHGCIVTRGEGGMTSRENVYAGGDAVTGAATVILAMGAGKAAAQAMDAAAESVGSKR